MSFDLDPKPEQTPNINDSEDTPSSASHSEQQESNAKPKARAKTMVDDAGGADTEGETVGEGNVDGQKSDARSESEAKGEDEGDREDGEGEGEDEGVGEAKGEGEGDGEVEGDGDGGDKSDIDDTKKTQDSESAKGAQTFEAQMSKVYDKIERHLDGSFMSNLQVGRALLKGLEIYEAIGKTVDDFDKIVAEKFYIRKTTAANLRRLSRTLLYKRKDILEVVNHPYLRRIGGTLMHELLVALDSKSKDKAKNLDRIALVPEGIFVKFHDHDELVDLITLTTRQLKERVEPKKPAPQAPATEGSDGPATEDKSATGSTKAGQTQPQTEPDFQIRYQALKEEHEATLKAHRKREQELQQELDAARKRADDLAAELEQLRAQALGGKVGE